MFRLCVYGLCAGRVGPRGPQGPTGPEGPSLTQLCSRIGGEVYKGVCFKRSKLDGNSDRTPPDCNVYNPRASWQESDYVALQRLFKDRPTWEQINRNSKGGLCTNFRATLAFEQHQVPLPPSLCLPLFLRSLSLFVYCVSAYLYRVSACLPPLLSLFLSCTPVLPLS
jgi:hypothetical protein